MKPKSTLILDSEFIQYCGLNKIDNVDKLAQETFNRGFSLLKYGETPNGNRTKEIVEVTKEVIKEVIVEVEKIVEVPVEVIKEVIKEVRIEVPIEVIREVVVEKKGKTKTVTKEVIKEVPVEKIVEVKLNSAETTMFNRSVEAVKKLIEEIKI